jgi:hypothetical protein
MLALNHLNLAVTLKTGQHVPQTAEQTYYSTRLDSLEHLNMKNAATSA